MESRAPEKRRVSSHPGEHNHGDRSFAERGSLAVHGVLQRGKDSMFLLATYSVIAFLNFAGTQLNGRSKEYGLNS